MGQPALRGLGDIGGAGHIFAVGDQTTEKDPMGVDDENLGSDAEMSGGVVQGDVAGGDPGPETKSRRAVGIIVFASAHLPINCPADAAYTLYSISVASTLTITSDLSVNRAAHAR